MDTTLGNAAHRWQDMLAAKDPRALARQCTAISKRSGERCQNAARRGKTVCGYHGVRRCDRITPELAARRWRSAEINAQREVVEALAETGSTPSEVRAMYAKMFAGRVADHDAPELFLALSKRLSGEMTTAEWRLILCRLDVV